MKKSSLPLALLALSLFAAPMFSAAQTVSEKDLKTNVQAISNPLQTIRALEPKTFEYNTKNYSYLSLPKGTQYGFLSEDLEKVVPGTVSTRRYTYMKGKNSYSSALVKSPEMEALVPLLVASVKEQQAQIDALKKEIEELRKMIRN